jgi:hypothetical protein
MGFCANGRLYRRTSRDTNIGANGGKSMASLCRRAGKIPRQPHGTLFRAVFTKPECNQRGPHESVRFGSPSFGSLASVFLYTCLCKCRYCVISAGAAAGPKSRRALWFNWGGRAASDLGKAKVGALRPTHRQQPIAAALRNRSVSSRRRRVGHATAALPATAPACERRSSRNVRQKAEPPLRMKDGSGVVMTW